MNIVKRLLKWLLSLFLIPVLYVGISLILTLITISAKDQAIPCNHTLFLSTNGVHLDIILPKSDIDSTLLRGITHSMDDTYIAFGWGDENFYIHTPTWNDLTFGNAFNALFLQSPTLIHVTRYRYPQNHWVKVELNEYALQQLNQYILQSFQKNKNGDKIILEHDGYTQRDAFYKAIGHYSCLNTCNSWVNTGFKTSGLKACYWTPFDFGLMDKYD